jgi:predicted transcriptional regulator
MALPDLPAAEFEVMTVLWELGEATGKEVQAVLAERRPLAYTTVATLLTRLRGRGYVAATANRGTYVFRPLIAREKAARRKLDDLVTRVFGGDIRPLAAYLAESRNLTKEQIAALEEIVRTASEKKEAPSGK